MNWFKIFSVVCFILALWFGICAVYTNGKTSGFELGYYSGYRQCMEDTLESLGINND